MFGLLRRTADVILVGAGTVRAEGYAGELLGQEGQSWRASHGMPPHPALTLVSGALNLDPDGPLFRQAPVRPLILTTAAAPENRRAALERAADVVVAGERTVEPEQAAAVLADRGFHRVPLTTAGNATRITAGTPEITPRRLELVHVLRSSDTLLLRYRSLNEGKEHGTRP